MLHTHTVAQIYDIIYMQYLDRAVAAAGVCIESFFFCLELQIIQTQSVFYSMQPINLSWRLLVGSLLKHIKKKETVKGFNCYLTIAEMTKWLKFS